jgi:phenylalanyl-tRNA synthetase beta chain
VEHAARDAAGNLADRVVLFDRFVGGSVPSGHASLGLRVVYRAADRTLTDAEVDARHAEVVSAVQNHFGATLRS